MRVTASPALETFKPEQIIRLCRKKQGWEAGGQEAGWGACDPGGHLISTVQVE